MSGNRIDDEQLRDSREESAMTPTIHGKTLVYRQDGQEQVLTVDTAAWFAWLETASTFSFVSEEGLFTAAVSRQVTSAGAGTGKPTANSMASSPLATWASPKPSRWRVYRRWPRHWLMLSSRPRLTQMRTRLAPRRKPQHLGCGAMHSPRGFQPSSIDPCHARTSCAAPSWLHDSRRE